MTYPDPALLRAALAVHAEGTVTRAAERLGLTQPAVSRLVAALEGNLGFPIFERARRRLRASERGRLYLAEAEAALGALARLSALGGELNRGRRGLLRIAAIPSLAHGLVARAVVRLLRDLPGVSVTLDALSRERQVEALLAARLDIGFAALPIGAAGLRVEPVAEADAVLLLPAGHRLARRAAVALAAIADEPFVAGRETTLLRQRTDDALARADRVRRVHAVTDDAALSAVLVAQGAGLAVVHHLPEDVLPPGVVARPIRPALAFGYAALTRADEPPPPLAAALVSAVRGAAGHAAPARD